MPDAFSPVGLMLDEWGSEIKTARQHEYKIIAINDLEPLWRGKLYLRIFAGENKISEGSVDLVIPSFGQASAVISLISPPSRGIYTVVASLERGNDKPVKSIREIPYR